jgi:hypothetical protein
MLDGVAQLPGRGGVVVLGKAAHPLRPSGVWLYLVLCCVRLAALGTPIVLPTWHSSAVSSQCRVGWFGDLLGGVAQLPGRRSWFAAVASFCYSCC